jgi:hypothetical protein
VKNVCVYIHMSECVEFGRELSLLPSNTASETSVQNSGAVQSVEWIFIIGAPSGGDWANT